MAPTARSDRSTPPQSRASMDVGAARTLADVMPDLLVEATRVAATVAAGWHGRRRAGSGEAFWQYRPLGPGEAVSRIDWRRSARDDQLYVREHEWAAAHTVWLAPDLTASMDWRSDLAPRSKRDGALVLTLALAELLGRAGERVGVPGHAPPRPHRHAAERVARTLVGVALPLALPEPGPITAASEVVVIGDFLAPLEEIARRLAALAATGARLHLVRVVDPAEERLPFDGRVEFHDPETGERLDVARAESLRPAWAARWRAHGDGLADLARRGHFTLLAHRTDRPPAGTLLALHSALGGARQTLATGGTHLDHPPRGTEGRR